MKSNFNSKYTYAMLINDILICCYCSIFMFHIIAPHFFLFRVVREIEKQHIMKWIDEVAQRNAAK